MIAPEQCETASSAGERRLEVCMDKLYVNAFGGLEKISGANIKLQSG
ncbi:hypothetical protein HSX11_14535 [Oxalobacteraceae bacterium]|nr:hypothetical protein [Oxalobacteraceae bacterium]